MIAITFMYKDLLVVHRMITYSLFNTSLINITTTTSFINITTFNPYIN